jgi:hypothetical protein
MTLASSGCERTAEIAEVKAPMKIFPLGRGKRWEGCQGRRPPGCPSDHRRLAAILTRGDFSCGIALDIGIESPLDKGGLQGGLSTLPHPRKCGRRGVPKKRHTLNSKA